MKTIILDKDTRKSFITISTASFFLLLLTRPEVKEIFPFVIWWFIWMYSAYLLSAGIRGKLTYPEFLDGW